MAVQYISMLTHQKKYIICTDSLSSLQAIGNSNIAHQIVKKIVDAMNFLSDHAQLMWVPSHQGISGNENADQLAVTAIPHSAEEVLAEVKKKTWAAWQREWQQQS